MWVQIGKLSSIRPVTSAFDYNTYWCQFSSQNIPNICSELLQLFTSRLSFNTRSSKANCSHNHQWPLFHIKPSNPRTYSSWSAAGVSRLDRPSTTWHPPISTLSPDLFGADKKPVVSNTSKWKQALGKNGEPQKKQTCPKCGELSCRAQGLDRRPYCDNSCQDCSQLDCVGWNRKYEQRLYSMRGTEWCHRGNFSILDSRN